MKKLLYAILLIAGCLMFTGCGVTVSAGTSYGGYYDPVTHIYYKYYYDVYSGEGYYYPYYHNYGGYIYYYSRPRPMHHEPGYRPPKHHNPGPAHHRPDPRRHEPSRPQPGYGNHQPNHQPGHQGGYERHEPQHQPAQTHGQRPPMQQGQYRGGQNPAQHGRPATQPTRSTSSYGSGQSRSSSGHQGGRR